MDLQIDSIKTGSYAAVVPPYVSGKRKQFEGYKDTLRVTTAIWVVVLITCLLAVTTQAKALSTEDDSFHLKAAIKIVDDIDRVFTSDVVFESVPLRVAEARLPLRMGFAHRFQSRSPPLLLTASPTH